MKNILIYNFNETYPKQGGMERVTDSLAESLVRMGHNVRLLCCKPNRLGEKYDAPAPLTFIPDYEDKSKARAFILGFLSQHHIDCVIDQSEGGIVGKYGFFKNRKPLGQVKLVAVFHSSARAQIRLMPYLLRRKMPLRCMQLLYDECYIPLRMWRATLLRKFLYREVNRNYDRMVLLSEAFFPEFEFYCPDVDRKKLAAIPNPNTFDIIGEEHFNKEKIVLFVGRLENLSKGVDRLLRIWAEVHASFPDWKLVLVGDGSDRGKLEQMAKDLKLTNYSFEGFCSPRPYYERAQVFCMTSNFEGFGMVLTEAMQFGCVPMAFHSYDSVTDIISSGKDGYIIPAFDEKEYAEYLKRLLTDDALRSELSGRARISVNKFSKENVIRKWTGLLDLLYNE